MRLSLSTLRPLPSVVLLLLSLTPGACGDDTVSPDATAADAPATDGGLAGDALPSGDGQAADAPRGDAAPPDAVPGDAAPPGDARWDPWSPCLESWLLPPEDTCGDYCDTQGGVCGGGCGPAADGLWYGAYFFATQATCLAFDVGATETCAATFGAQEASGRDWARCCCD